MDVTKGSGQSLKQAISRTWRCPGIQGSRLASKAFVLVDFTDRPSKPRPTDMFQLASERRRGVRAKEGSTISGWSLHE